MKVLEKFPELPATVAHLGAHEYAGFLGFWNAIRAYIWTPPFVSCLRRMKDTTWEQVILKI